MKLTKITSTLRKIQNYALSKLIGNYSHIKRPKLLNSSNGNSQVLNGMVAYNEYGGYFTPISSQQRPAVQAILNGNVYEPQTIAYIRDNCSQGDIIHAGTFFGDFLPGICSALAAGSQVWAFEPNPENFKCAQITCMINGLKNVNLFNVALGDSTTTSQMVVKSSKGKSLGGASYVSDKNKEDETIEIDIVKIDDILPSERHIAIVHLDVEGYEKQALIGAMETIRRNRPILILEDNNNIIESDWFNDAIVSLGYYKATTFHENTVFISRTPHNNT